MIQSSRNRALSSEYRKTTHRLVRDKNNVVACPSETKILEAIMILYRSGPVTVRKITGYLGNSAHHVHAGVRSLREKGLISFEDHLSGTIVPRVRFIPEEQLWKD